MRLITAVGAFLLLCCVLFGLCVYSLTVQAADIPHAAAQYRATLTRAAHSQWGLDAPVATFAAQVQQESRWRINARSPVGAMGLAQFMPGTARWIGGAIPALNTLPADEAGAGLELPSRPEARAAHPVWALRALVAYDKWLFERVRGDTPCERMAFTLSAYNGGLGWVQRDVRLAQAHSADPSRWFDQVERYNAGRSAAAWRENRGYPRIILRQYEPLYVRAGWGLGVCG